MTFQKSTNQFPAPAVAGDFASKNPRASVLAGQNALMAGTLGVTVGNFAWVSSVDEATTNSYAPSNVTPSGFCANVHQALITAYLGEASVTVPAGFPVTLFNGGDFWAKNLNASAASVVGQKVYAQYADGGVQTAATGTPPTNAGITANTATNTTLTVTVNTGAAIVVGMPVSGAGIAAGTYISALGTGTGGAGTYTLSQATTATASGVTVTATLAIETKWYVASVGAAGELIKITSTPLN